MGKKWGALPQSPSSPLPCSQPPSQLPPENRNIKVLAGGWGLAREAHSPPEEKGAQGGQALDLLLCLSCGEVVLTPSLLLTLSPSFPPHTPSWVRSVRALGNRLAYRRLAFHICLQTHNTLLFQGQ